MHQQARMADGVPLCYDMKEEKIMNPFKKKAIDPQQILVLDTCGLIDGRIVDIARAGFVPQNIIVPQFIVAELQYLADQGDSHKRERARFGLDVVRELQDLKHIEVTIARDKFPNIDQVDDKLIAIAKRYGAMLYTTDYNLNKVAQIESVLVLNVNELAQALRPHRLPGEKLEIKITQVGQDHTQGVGYLDDGTMVVVERAGRKVGQRVRVEFSRMLQTQAGKMMFATLVNNESQKEKQPVAEKPQKPKQSQQVAKQTPNTASAAAPSAVHHAYPKKSYPNTSSQQNTRSRHKKASPEDALLKAIDNSNQE